MSNKEKTCGNCENVNFNPSDEFSVAGCKLTGYVIPHECIHTKQKLTFWRVPMVCPRSEGVHKSKQQAPRKEWVIKQWSDFS